MDQFCGTCSGHDAVQTAPNARLNGSVVRFLDFLTEIAQAGVFWASSACSSLVVKLATLIRCSVSLRGKTALPNAC